MNLQPVEKFVEEPRHFTLALDVVGVWRTIQGEGPHTGRPAIFVRLAGCNLQCPGCDTDYTSNRKFRNPGEISSYCRELANGITLVVITGGEPLRQDIHPLCCDLLRMGFDVQIETNGTFYRRLPFESKRLMIVCSPKTPIINDQLIPKVRAFKYVLEAGHISEEDGLPTNTLGQSCGVARPGPGPFHKDVEIYVSPLDAGDAIQNALNTKATVESAMRFNYRLSIQTHKLIGMP